MRRELTGRKVLVWLVASFGVVLAVNIYFIVIAVKTFRGEDEQKPYLQGVEYNQTIARRAEQEKLGWKAAIGATRLPTGAVRVAVTLKQANGAPETNVSLTGELRHPADETRDRPMRLLEASPGEYVAELSGVKMGAWDVIVTTQAQQSPFEASRRLWVP